MVDNASTDGSRELIRDNYHRVKLIALPENVDFVRANNVGLNCAAGKYIVLLNPDCSVPRDFVERLVESLESNPKIAAVSCSIATRGSFVRYAPVFFDASGLIAVHRQAIYTPCFCLAPCGAAAIYRRDVLRELGEFLDGDFVSDWEDHDLGYRINLQGYWCVHNPNIVVHHIGGVAYGMSIKRKIRICRNMLLTYFKNMELGNFVKAFWPSSLFSPAPIPWLIGVILFLKEVLVNQGIRRKRRLLQRNRRRGDAYIQMLTSGRCLWVPDGSRGSRML